MKNITDINFKGLKALIRVDFNVPLNDKFEITDDSRIRSTIPTLKKILDDEIQVENWGLSERWKNRTLGRAG